MFTEYDSDDLGGGGCITAARHREYTLRPLSQEELDCAMRRGHRLRSEMYFTIFGTAFHGLGRAVVALARTPGRALAALAEARRQHRAQATMARLDGHLLADMGVRREELPGLVSGTLSRPDAGGGRTAAPVDGPRLAA